MTSLRLSTDCDVKITPELRMLLLDAGLEHEAFYLSAHGAYIMVGKSAGVRKLVIANTPEQAIEMAEKALYGGL